VEIREELLEAYPSGSGGSGVPFIVVTKGKAEERTVGRVVAMGRKFRSVTTKKKFPPY
jgi:hypothetical protein